MQSSGAGGLITKSIGVLMATASYPKNLDKKSLAFNSNLIKQQKLDKETIKKKFKKKKNLTTNVIFTL